jgi:hypothetical protein
MSAAPATATVLTAGAKLGSYVLGPPLWQLRIADAYRAHGPTGAATLYVIHPAIAGNTAVRDQIIAGTRAAAALPEHKHLVHTIAAGLTGDVLWLATEDVEGALLRDVLLKKRAAAGPAGASGAGGLGGRGTANLIAGVAEALAEAPHGALATESVILSRTGRVKVADLALGAGTAAAIAAGLIPASSAIAPEISTGQPPAGPADVYGLGALLYESLLGRPLERGGPRPSELLPGATNQLDEVVARACHRDPERRFSRTDVFGEVVAEALGPGGALADGGASAANSRVGTTTGVVKSLAAEVGGGAIDPAAAGGDRVLAAALADTTEKWLVTKGKLDYGPFSLADVLAQIDKGDIVAGNVIMDKDSGARIDVAKHALLGPLVDAARQRRDDARRAQAEVHHQRRDKKRGAMLYAFIGLGVVGAVAAVYLVIRGTRHEEATKVAGISSLDGASLKVKVSEPKRPPPSPRGHHGGAGTTGANGGPAPANTGENLALDMSGDDDDGSDTLDMGTVFGVYSKFGGQLGGCLQGAGESSVTIGIIIDGPSGKVTWVKVNGKQAGPAYACLSRVLRGMKFPSIHGPRTRAEFDISL